MIWRPRFHQRKLVESLLDLLRELGGKRAHPVNQQRLVPSGVR